MNGVEIKRTVKLSLKAADWHLYSGMKGVEAVAKYLNRCVEEAVNSSDTMAEAQEKAGPALERYSKFGAADSEGWWVLHRILREAYPRSVDWD